MENTEIIKELYVELEETFKDVDKGLTIEFYLQLNQMVYRDLSEELLREFDTEMGNMLWIILN